MRPLSFVALLSLLLPTTTHAQTLKHIGDNPQTATSQAIRVEHADLIYTTQLLPLDAEGKIFGPGNFEHQAEQIFSNLKAILIAAGSDVDQIVRLHLHLRDAKLAPMAHEVLKDIFEDLPHPTVTFASGKLPHPDALLAVDVIAAAPISTEKTARSYRVDLLQGSAAFTHAKRLPFGKIAHISGQAEKGANLAACTRNTLLSLQRTLEGIGLSWRDVVSIKCFLTPMEHSADVHRTISEVLGGKDIPPVVCVDWISTLPIEIEVVAAANNSPTAIPNGDNALYLTPPGMTKSPVYSKVALMQGPGIYLSGLFASDAKAPDAKTPDEETRDLFLQLKELLPAAGTDFNHLLKATYYCGTDATSKALNTIRPEYYPPERPPTASKALVPGVGRPDRNVTLDLIATPAK